jgi:hypothetical protein
MLIRYAMKFLVLMLRDRYHLENPYWQTFDKYVIPLLAKDMDLRRLNELDTTEQVRVEQDSELWEKVKKHQTY